MSMLYQALDRTAKVLIDLDPDSKSKFGALEGKVFCLKLTGPEITLFLLPDGNGIRVSESVSGEPDVTLTGSALAFAKLGAGGSGSGVLSSGQVKMEGDADAGQAFQKILAQLDLDFEELMSRYIGDVPARKAGNITRSLGGWAKETIDLSTENTADFLKEEAKVLVTPLAMERLENDMHDLRSDVDRLEQRLVRLEAKRDKNLGKAGEK